MGGEGSMNTDGLFYELQGNPPNVSYLWMHPFGSR